MWLPGRAVDVIAVRQQSVADPAVNWRAHLGIFIIKLRKIPGGLGGEQRALGFLIVGLARIGFLDRDGVVGQKLRRARGFASGVLQAHPRLFEFRLSLIERRLVPARIDHEQHVALFHQLTGLKLYLLDEPGNARTNLDRFHRFNAAGELFLIDDFPALDRRDRHCGRRGRDCGFSRMSVTAA